MSSTNTAATRRQERIPRPNATHPNGWDTPSVGAWTGAAAIAVAFLTSLEFVLRQTLVGVRPRLDQTAAIVAFNRETAAGTMAVILTDTFLMATLLVFLSGFRQIIVQSRKDIQWIADIAFAAGIGYVCVTLVGDGLEAGTALDATVAGGNASVIEALTVGHALFFGSIGCVMTALVSGASGYITLISGALPRWTGKLAIVVAAVNLGAVGTAFGGTDDNSIQSAGGWGSVVFGTFPWLVWVVSVGVAVIRYRVHHQQIARAGRENPLEAVDRQEAVAAS